MFEIIEKSIRHPHFAKGGNTHKVWYASDERDFIRKVKEIAMIDTRCIYHKSDADTLLFDFDETDYKQIENWDRHDLELQGYDYYKDLADGHPFGWHGDLYRADFLNGHAEGNYSDIVANEFEAYQAFLKFVSRDVQITELRFSEGEVSKTVFGVSEANAKVA